MYKARANNNTQKKSRSLLQIIRISIEWSAEWKWKQIFRCGWIFLVALFLESRELYFNCKFLPFGSPLQLISLKLYVFFCYFGKHIQEELCGNAKQLLIVRMLNEMNWKRSMDYKRTDRTEYNEEIEKKNLWWFKDVTRLHTTESAKKRQKKLSKTLNRASLMKDCTVAAEKEANRQTSIFNVRWIHRKPIYI